MSSMKSVLLQAGKLAVPTHADERSLLATSELLKQKAHSAVSRFPEVVDFVFGGSFAKGTWLPQQHDLDIFVRIDAGTPESRFEEVGLAVGNAMTRGYPRGKKYAQHPYTEALVEEVKVNVVPCYAVKARMWKSAADRSPFHVELVKALPASRKREIRLLKLFMRGIGVYGAEIEVKGFSGYAAEVLVIRQGGFLQVLKHFSASVPPKDGAFTLPDPVDEGRDLARAISGEKLGRLVLASREFLKAPNLRYFTDLRGRHRASLASSVTAVVFKHKPLVEDILWGELRKTGKHLVRHLETRAFRIARWMCASDNLSSSAFLLIPEFTVLPRMEQRVGPTVDRADDVKSFLSSNSKTSLLVWVDDDARVRLIKAREFMKLTTLLGALAAGRVEPIGASDDIAAALRKGARILNGPALSSEMKRSRWLARGVTEIVSDALGTS